MAAAAAATLEKKSPRLFIKERYSNQTFLIDTGSEVSVIPALDHEKKVRDLRYNLAAVNKSKVHTYGVKKLSLNIGFPKTYEWNFIVADVTVPIIGADFLVAHKLLPDLHEKKLIEKHTLLATPCETFETYQDSICVATDGLGLDEKIVQLLHSKYFDLLKPPQYLKEPQHDVVHFIETGDAAPEWQKPRRLRPEVEKKVKNEFRRMEEIGVVRQSKSQLSAPIVVQEKNNDVRIMGDYRRLNKVTRPDRYPLPNMCNVVNNISKKYKYFSKIDLIRAYYNIRIFGKHVSKTALTSGVGLFEFLRMPFGLRNAPATFQRFINEVLRDIDNVFVYLDDILIFTETLEEHYKIMEQVFERLVKYGLTINIKKCKFCVSEIEFLGFHIAEKGYKPMEDRSEKIKQMVKPKTIVALRRVIGAFNHYRMFKKEAAKTLAPLNELLKGRTKKNDRTLIKWTPTLEKAFEDAKRLFSEYTMLNYPENGAVLYLVADASNEAVGAVLEQVNTNNIREPLGYFSKKLDEAQMKWPVYDRELYALYAAAIHFEYMIEGREVIYVTDHRPLLHMFTTKKPCRIQRRSRYIEYLAQFSSVVQVVSGNDNVVADHLSRPEADENAAIENVEFSLEKLVELQQSDPEIKNYKRNNLEKVNMGSIVVLCVVSGDRRRPFVPKDLRYVVFKALHEISHPGRRATQRTIGLRYYWPRMYSDIAKWTKACDKCQRSKIQRHTKQEAGKFPPSQKFEHVHMDLVILNESNGYRYVCTISDRATRWLEAIPIKNLEAETVADAFVRHWVARYGTPLKLTTDRGAQFTSKLFEELNRVLGIHHIKTTSYNPKANGIIERQHRRLKQALKCQGKQWFYSLPIVLLGIRSSPREEDGITTAELLYGENLRLPGEFFAESPEIKNPSKYIENIREAFRKNRPTRFNASKQPVFVHPDLEVCKEVYIRVDRVREPLEFPYEGPYTVLKRSKKWYKLDVKGTKETVSIDRLKPAYKIAEELVSDGRFDGNLKPILCNKNDICSREKKKVRFFNVTNQRNPVDVPLPPSPNFSDPEYRPFSVSQPQIPVASNPSLLNREPVAQPGQMVTRLGRQVRPPKRLGYE